MELNQLASFIIRFHLAELDEGTSNKHWRIKVTHVQQESETLFKTIEEAMEYMKTIVEAS